MPHIIKSGVGKGTLAKINDENQLCVESGSIKHIAYVSSRKNLAFEFTTSQFTITNSEYAVLRFKPTNDLYDMYIERISINWNGGNTNHDRVAFIKLYMGMEAPSANNSSITPVNIKIDNTSTADADIDQWDTVGSGMTVSSNGDIFKLIHASQGYTPVDLHGSVVVPKNGIIGITAEGEEDGKLSLGLTYYAYEKGVS